MGRAEEVAQRDTPEPVRQPYAGDSPGKRRVRTLLYDAASTHWTETFRPVGDAVVLAGDEAREAPNLSRLGFRPHECLFVDHMFRSGLEAAREAIPGARTYFGDIRTALKRVRRLSFLHLDLMGLPGQLAEESLALAGERAELHSVIAFTFIRGHECYHTVTGTKMLEAMGSPERITPEMRWKYVRSFVPAALDRSTEIIYEADYVSRIGMSCIAVAVTD